MPDFAPTDLPRPLTTLCVVIGPPLDPGVHEALADSAPPGSDHEPGQPWVDFIEELLPLFQTPTSDRESMLDFLLSDVAGRPVHCEQINLSQCWVGDEWRPTIQLAAHHVVDENGDAATDLFDDPATSCKLAAAFTVAFTSEWIHSATKPQDHVRLAPSATTWKRS
jgi:hypothetical protein